jgi:hypothetical protein
MGYYSPNPHYAPDDFSGDTKRHDEAQALASRYFRDATKPQAAKYAEQMAVIRPYAGSPKWERAREVAWQEYRASTEAAAALCNETYREMYDTGEVSDELSYRWDELIAASAAVVHEAA